MTDDTPIYINAFSSIFGKTDHVLCKWHIKRSLFSKIKTHFGKNDAKKAEWLVEKLIDSSTKLEFDESLKLLKKLSHDNNEDFWKYFDTHYLKRKAKWALHSTEKYQIRTNMHLESFHKTLKYHIFEKKRNKRCDLLISALQKYFRQKKSGEKKYTFQHRKIHAAHYVATKRNYIVEVDSKNSFNVIVIT